MIFVSLVEILCRVALALSLGPASSHGVRPQGSLLRAGFWELVMSQVNFLGIKSLCIDITRKLVQRVADDIVF